MRACRVKDCLNDRHQARRRKCGEVVVIKNSDTRPAITQTRGTSLDNSSVIKFVSTLSAQGRELNMIRQFN